MTVFRERKLQSRWDTRLFNSLRDLIEPRNVARLKFPFVHFVDARKLSHRFSIIFLQARLCIKRERDENGTRPFNFTSVSIHRRAFFFYRASFSLSFLPFHHTGVRHDGSARFVLSLSLSLSSIFVIFILFPGWEENACKSGGRGKKVPRETMSICKP